MLRLFILYASIPRLPPPPSFSVRGQGNPVGVQCLHVVEDSRNNNLRHAPPLAATDTAASRAVACACGVRGRLYGITRIAIIC